MGDYSQMGTELQGGYYGGFVFIIFLILILLILASFGGYCKY